MLTPIEPRRRGPTVQISVRVTPETAERLDRKGPNKHTAARDVLEAWAREQS